MRMIMAGAAAIALAASGAYAQGNGKGNGNGNGGGNKPAAAQGQQGNGNGNGNSRGDRGNDRGDRGPSREVERRVERSDRGDRGQGRQADRGDRGQDRGDNHQGNRQDRRGDYGNRRDVEIRYGDRDDRRIVRGDRDYRWLVEDRSRGLIDGCPPGLAKKRNGCNPPGQVKDRYERNLFGYNYRPNLFGLTNYGRGDYYYNEGYLVRYGDGGGISGWIPLLGGALGIGNVWPTGYRSYDVPDYYVDYYNLGGRDRYRYADNVIYRVDPEDAAITSIAALITGDQFTIGQPVPRGYDVYNVPYAYRDRYYDTPQYMYRYSDGYVYQIDPETRLVAAAIDLLI